MTFSGFFLSERIFGRNVMVEVALQESKNPMAAVADALQLPNIFSDQITAKLPLPMKLMVPRDVLHQLGLVFSLTGVYKENDTMKTTSSLPSIPDASSDDKKNSSQQTLTAGIDADSSYNFSVIGLGDIALPGLLVTLARFCDARSHRESSRVCYSNTYFITCFCGHILGILLSQIMSALFGPQPALIYLVPCTIVPFLLRAAHKNELNDVWNRPARSWSEDE